MTTTQSRWAPRSFLAGAAVAGLSIVLASAGFQSGVWEERDPSGRVRVRGAFAENGDYVLTLFDGAGAESVKLVAPAAGGGTLSLSDAVILESQGANGALLLKAKSGASVRIGASEEGSVMLLDCPGRGRVEMSAAAERSRIEVSNGRSAVVWDTSRDGSRLRLGGAESPGVEISEAANGERVVGIGLAKRTGRVSIVSSPDGAMGLTLVNSAQKTRVNIQDVPEKGAGIMILHDSGEPAIKIGLKANGAFSTELLTPDGKAVEVLGDPGTEKK